MPPYFVEIISANLLAVGKTERREEEGKTEVRGERRKGIGQRERESTEMG